VGGSSLDAQWRIMGTATAAGPICTVVDLHEASDRRESATEDPHGVSPRWRMHGWAICMIEAARVPNCVGMS
jgi:hypothetical protein